MFILVCFLVEFIMTERTIIIKLGGSTFSMDKDNIFDFAYLHDLRQIIDEFDARFFLIVGGGYTSRRYRDLAKEAGITQDEELHWIGTTVNVLHAELVRAFFSEIAEEGVFKYEDYYEKGKIDFKKKIRVGGGGRPGHSGDVDAILVAKRMGVKKVFSLKNVDGVYSKDPKIHSDAKLIKELNWDQYIEIIGEKAEHEPGGNYPVDPIASKMAQKEGIEFIVLGSSNLLNFQNAICQKEFHGTVISDL